MSQGAYMVRIKRKKDEEPVESLYVQIERSQKKRRFSNFVFRRVVEGNEDSNAELQVSSDLLLQGQEDILARGSSLIQGTSQRENIPDSSRHHPPCLSSTNSAVKVSQFESPLIHRPSSGNDESTGNPSTWPAHVRDNDPQAAETQGTKDDGFKGLSTTHVRRFRLTKSVMSFPQAPAGRVHKSRRDGKASLALLFEESRPHLKRPLLKKENSRREGIRRQHARRSSQSLEKKTSNDAARADQALQQPIEALSGSVSTEASQHVLTALAAIDSSEGRELVPTPFRKMLAELFGPNMSVEEEPARRQLRIEPKAPARRYQDSQLEKPTGMVDVVQNNPNVTMQNAKNDDGDDWVYDSYIRFSGHNTAIHDTVDPSVGLLIIDDETEGGWDWLENWEQGEDDECNDEEEDENAEDWYGNDYPEEESHSADDEDGNDGWHDRTAYWSGQEDDSDNGEGIKGAGSYYSRQPWTQTAFPGGGYY